MKNLPIRHKLAACFALLFVALIALGLVSILQLGKLADHTKDLVENRLVKLEAAAAINTSLSDFRTAEATHILSLSPEDQAKASHDLLAQKKIIDEKAAWLDKHVDDAPTRDALGQFKQDWAAYLDSSTEVIAHSELNENDEALRLFRAQFAQFDKASAMAAKVQDAQAAIMDRIANEAHGTFVMSRIVMIGALVLVAILTGAMLVWLVRAIATPLSAMAGALGELARGRMNVSVPIEERADEVGDLATAMIGLRDQLIAADEAKAQQARLIVDSIGTGLGALAKGDLTAHVDAELTGTFATLKENFNHAVEELRAAIASVSTSAASISTGSTEIRSAADDLAARTEQQAASLEESAAALSQVNEMVQETARNAVQVGGSITKAESEAQAGGAIVERAVNAMNGIARSSQEIAQIISLIDGIAFQTNLLALNAGVEAARAGEAGKGFAVVASEVRALAQRSADAAKDIKELIQKSGEQVGNGVELVGETGKMLSRMVERIGEVSELVRGIQQAAEAQATNLQQVSVTVGEMDKMTQQNTAMVEESTAAARSLASEAGDLAMLVGRFRTSDRPPARGAMPAAAMPVRAPEPRARRPLPQPPAMRANLAVRAQPMMADEEDWTDF